VFTFRFGSGFEVRGSRLEVRGGWFGPPFAFELRTPNPEPNLKMNTNREVRTEKGERLSA
jgi:hypothetical protein